LLKRDPSNAAPAEEAFLTAVTVTQQQKAKSLELKVALSMAEVLPSDQSPGRRARRPPRWRLGVSRRRKSFLKSPKRRYPHVAAPPMRIVLAPALDVARVSRDRGSAGAARHPTSIQGGGDFPAGASRRPAFATGSSLDWSGPPFVHGDACKDCVAELRNLAGSTGPGQRDTAANANALRRLASN
jgi:hypothetical protein